VIEDPNAKKLTAIKDLKSRSSRIKSSHWSPRKSKHLRAACGNLKSRPFENRDKMRRIPMLRGGTFIGKPLPASGIARRNHLSTETFKQISQPNSPPNSTSGASGQSLLRKRPFAVRALADLYQSPVVVRGIYEGRALVNVVA